MFTTGIPTCDALREIAFTGNIIPQIWYKVFVKRDLKSPKPHLLAINILADIVYWYRPSEVRDELTGAVIGIRKKFSSDMLQRNYAQIADMFGCSERQAKDAIIFLEQMGVVRREFRTVETGGVVRNNIMFIDLNVDRLRELTYPQEKQSTERNAADPLPNFQQTLCRNSDTPCDKISTEPVPKFRQSLCRNSDTPCDKISTVYKDYYTENTTEITTKNSTKISEEKSVRLTDGRVREKTEFADVADTEALVRKIRDRGDIPAMGLKQTRMLVHWLCEYDYYTKHTPERTSLKDAHHLKVYKLFTDCLCSMMTSQCEHAYNGDAVSAADVRDAVYRIAPNLCIGELDEFAEETVNIFCDAMDNHDIKNVKGYMKSVIWNGFSEFPMNREE